MRHTYQEFYSVRQVNFSHKMPSLFSHIVVYNLKYVESAENTVTKVLVRLSSTILGPFPFIFPCCYRFSSHFISICYCRVSSSTRRQMSLCNSVSQRNVDLSRNDIQQFSYFRQPEPCLVLKMELPPFCTTVFSHSVAEGNVYVTCDRNSISNRFNGTVIQIDS